MNRFQFVADHRDAFEVKRLCAVLHVSRSSFYAWLAAAPTRAARTGRDAALAERIRVIHSSDTAQGVSSVWPYPSLTVAPKNSSLQASRSAPSASPPEQIAR